MENNIHVDVKAIDGVSEVTIRQGEASIPFTPVSTSISGDIEAPGNYFLKRMKTDSINTEAAYVEFDYVKGTIRLVLNENIKELCSIIRGSLVTNPYFEKFKIGNTWSSPKEFGEFLRMNRRFFKDKSAYDNLLKQMLSFKARLERDIERTDNNRGNRKDMVAQSVVSDIPEMFILEMPLFRGVAPSIFKVEIFFDIRDAGCTVQLISPEAEEAAVVIVEKCLAQQEDIFSPFIPVIRL